MADNVSITQGTGTTIATEDVSGVQHQKVKIEFGGDGVATLVSASDPLPVSATIDTTGLATTATDTNTATIAGAITASRMQVDVISGGGGGTQYTEGDVDASITGTAAMMEVAGNTLQPVQGTVADGLLVNLGSNNDVTVTGSVTATQATGTNLHVVVDSAPTTAVTGTFYQATQPVSAASLPLPTGASTAAKQPALGTAGTPSADVITVQGVTSMTALKVDGSAVTQPVSGTFYQATQPVSLATLPALVAGSALVGKVSIDQVTANANEVVTKTGSVTAATLSAETTKVIGTVNVAAGQTIAVTNAGTFATQATLQTGSNAIGKLAANSGVDIGDVDILSIAAGTNNIGQISVAPQTANGLSVFNATSSDGATALTSTAQAIKASAGQVYGWYIYNPNTSAQFVQFYNTAAASVTVGTTNPLFMLTIPASSAANVEFTNGITFSNAGFSCAATSTAGGNGAPTSALDAVIFYK